MNRILKNRVPRSFKADLPRYLALIMLVAMAMYIIISLASSAETIIGGTAVHQKMNRVEDGQFGVFIPLTEAQEKELRDSGITLEKMFSLDIKAEDNSTLRLMKNRTEIDLIDTDSGREAEKIGEAVIEKRYAEEHSLSVGDSVTAAAITFEITGIGTVPDYDAPFEKMSDAAVSSKNFGLIFVTDEQYEQIKETAAQSAEDIRYAYRLNGKMTDDELKDRIKAFEFNYKDVTDKYYLEAVGEALEKRDELKNGISELLEGAEELRGGLSELSDGAEELRGGLSELSDGAEELRDGLSELSDGTRDLSDGAREVSDGSKILYGAVSALTGGISGFEASYLESRGFMSEINDFTDGVKAVSDGAGAVADGAEKAADGASAAAEGSKRLSDGISAAKDGADGLSGGIKAVSDGADELVGGISELKGETDKILDDIFDVKLDNLTSFIKRADNVRIGGAAGDVVMNKMAGLIFGVIAMILFTYVISVFVIHQIRRESAVIGALYALGARKCDLIVHYITLPSLTVSIGGTIGAVIGFSPIGQGIFMASSYSYFSLPEFSRDYPLYLIIYAIFMPPAVSAAVNAAVINKQLSRTALSLLKNEQNNAKLKGVKLKSRNFVRNFRTRQMIREMRTSVTILLGMFFSLLIVSLSLDVYCLCTNIGKDTSRDTRYEYMYMLKYPESEIPEGGEACYAESLSKEQYGYTLDVMIMGIDGDNKYFGADVKKGRTSVTAGKAVCERYGIKTGDKLILTDEANNMDYAFTAVSTCDYSAGLTVFMDIDSMRELFGREEGYYNCILSDSELDIDSGRIYSVTTKADAEKSAQVFIDLMSATVVTLSAVAVTVFVTVMYLMQSVMIDRASFGISLIKIFGFRTGEIKKLYLDGNAFTVAAGAVIGIPAAKIIMDRIFPMFIPNVACGINLTYPPALYLILFCAVMLVYFVINASLVRKINGITPADVLKNRE